MKIVIIKNEFWQRWWFRTHAWPGKYKPSVKIDLGMHNLRNPCPPPTKTKQRPFRAVLFVFSSVKLAHGGLQGWIALRSHSLTHTHTRRHMPALHLLVRRPFYVSMCNEGDMTDVEKMENLRGPEVTNGRERRMELDVICWNKGWNWERHGKRGGKWFRGSGMNESKGGGG